MYVHWYIRMYVHVTYHSQVHARVMEAENSITLTTFSSENAFISLGWHSENDYGFTYQDREYLIRAMNTKHAQCTCCTSSW